jgi:hypothetical protein
MKLVGLPEIRQRMVKLWDSQKLQRAWLADEPLFPLEIPLGAPTGNELAERFGEVRAWIAALKAEAKETKGYGFVLVEQQVAHRQLGLQRLPVRAVVPSVEDALRLAGKWQAFQRLQGLVKLTRERLPALEPYLQAKPQAALEHADAWERLLEVCAGFLARPRPGCYARALDLPGVDTKFIEQHEAVLWDLLALVLPAEAQEPSVSRRDAQGFARRFGLLAEPPLVRFRVLDPALAPAGFTDLAVPLPELARWSAPGVRRVFVTENKLNGLAFPPVPGAIVIFGLGHGVQLLGELAWLADRELAYWGDLDTHGFAMLARLRGHWPHTSSMLMDEATLLAHRPAWGQEPAARRWLQDLEGLTPGEQTVFDGLRQDRWGERVRLEQERVPLALVRQALAAP